MTIVTHITSAERAVGIVTSRKIRGVSGTSPKERFPHFFPKGQEVGFDLPVYPEIALLFDAQMPEIKYVDNSSFAGRDMLVRFLDEYILLPGPTPLVLHGFQELNDFELSEKDREILQEAVEERRAIFAADGFTPSDPRNGEGVVGRVIKKVLG